MHRASEVEKRTHQFSVGDATPRQAIVDALAFVQDADPREFPPIGEVVDLEALEALLESSRSVAVSFEYEDLDVTVRGGGEIEVTAPDPEPRIHRDLDGVSNVLLVGETGSGPCREHLSAFPPERTDVVGVLTSRSADDFIRDWGSRSPANGVVLEVGGAVRSAAVDASTVGVAGFSIESVSGLSAVGIRVAEILSGWAGDENDLVVCFDALEDVLAETGIREVFMFLEPFLSRVRMAGGIAHVHLDPAAVDDRTRYTLEPLFDAVVEVDADGERTVRRG